MTSIVKPHGTANALARGDDGTIERFWDGVRGRGVSLKRSMPWYLGPVAALAVWTAALEAQAGKGFLVRPLLEAGPSVTLNVPAFKDEEARWQLAAATGLVAQRSRDAFGGAFQVVIDKSWIQGALQGRYHRWIAPSVTVLAAAGPILFADADAEIDLIAPGWTLGLTARHSRWLGATLRLDILPIRDRTTAGPTPGDRKTFRVWAVGLQADGRPGAIVLAAGLLVALAAGGGWN
jgi:hypothetical protein